MIAIRRKAQNRLSRFNCKSAIANLKFMVLSGWNHLLLGVCVAALVAGFDRVARMRCIGAVSDFSADVGGGAFILLGAEFSRVCRFSSTSAA